MKVVICGAGFIGNYVARAFAASNPGIQIVLASRQPKRHVDDLQDAHAHISSASADVTNASTLRPVFQDAHTVVSLVGILQGSPAKFEAVQWKGAQNVAQCAQEVGAKLVHLSAIGANPDSELVSPRTKGLGEKAVLEAAPTATVIRPSLVFGPGDSFFTRFATLARFFPVMPVIGSGMSKFQPVYVGDLAKLIEVCSRSKGDASIAKKVDGKILEAGGPEVFTFREILQLVFKYSGRWRPMVPIPLWAGYMQGALLEKLPESILTISRDQVAQLQLDNVVADAQKDIVPKLLESQTGESMKSVHDILPTYLSS